MEKWNAQRAQAVYSALVRFLYPLMQKELRNKLFTEAKEHVLQVHVHYTCLWLLHVYRMYRASVAQLLGSAARVYCLEYRVSWVQIPPEAAHFFFFEK